MDRITLFTKPGCHLCDDARVAVQRIAAAAGVGWTEIDITDDDDLMDEYGEMIPVILLDGRVHGYWRVEEERLRRDLARTVS
ncbi:MAG TPA: glutaredoxin family protein [Micromonosporaceae bacterium]|jgi:glutaredoxin